MPPRKQPPLYDLDFTLRRKFRKKSFRPMQKEVIQAALKGDDVYLQAATSFGKSLCFQLPAVLDHGLTIVVSPLLSLMMNQIDALKAKDVRVETINGSTPFLQRKEIIEDVQRGHPRLKMLYVTPELCNRDWFRKLLQTIYQHGQLSRFVIDEAHCVSQWGHDFRKDFLELCYFRQEFPDVPVMCATATATSRVKNDIINIMRLDAKNLKSFTMPTCRPNLHYEIRFRSEEEDERYRDFLKWLKDIYARRKTPGRAKELQARQERLDNVSGIIYVISRDGCEALAEKLRRDGIGAKPYHAKLRADKRKDHLTGWIENRPGYDIIVATTAFGMGIDKEDVRFVAHWMIPKSFEGYYQEAGRAGRDGKASICLMYYSHEDREWMESMLAHNSWPNKKKDDASRAENIESRKKSFAALVDYCQSTNKCRHKMIAEYFEDSLKPVCDWACDWHKDAQKLRKEKEAYDQVGSTQVYHSMVDEIMWDEMDGL